MRLWAFVVLLLGGLVGSGQVSAAIVSTLTFDMAADVTTASGEVTHYEHFFSPASLSGAVVTIYDDHHNLISEANPDPATGTYASINVVTGAPATTQAYINQPDSFFGTTSAYLYGGTSSTVHLTPGSTVNFKVTYSFESALASPVSNHTEYSSDYLVSGSFLVSDTYSAGISYQGGSRLPFSEDDVFDWSYRNSTGSVVPVSAYFGFQHRAQGIPAVPEPEQGAMLLLGLSVLGLRLMGRGKRE